MPSRYTLETLPEPAKLMAVRRYSGRWTRANYRENAEALLRALAGAGLRPVSAPVYARYNSPFSLWFLRRNEVMTEIEEAKQPQ